MAWTSSALPMPGGPTSTELLKETIALFFLSPSRLPWELGAFTTNPAFVAFFLGFSVCWSLALLIAAFLTAFTVQMPF